MSLNRAIFIFTKDRPEILMKAIESTKDIGITRFIIDDSFQFKNQTSNKDLSFQYSKVSYNGKSEFDDFINLYKIDINKNKSFLRQIGNKDWNLGYARNFALLLAKANNIHEVMFIDDDITIPNLDLVIKSFNLLEQFDFVGANIKGMIDDSIIGHLSNELGLVDNDERMLSGGFLSFKSNKIRIPFINIYNEDWLWLFLHTLESKYLQKGSVIQNYANPFLGFKKKIVFQEIGEIIIVGILDQKRLNKSDLLTTELFWEKILKERIVYLEYLESIATEKKYNEIHEIIHWLLENNSEINSLVFSNIFKELTLSAFLFNEIYNSISISKITI